MNDQLMYLERAFIDPLGLPGRPFYRLVTYMGIEDAMLIGIFITEEKSHKYLVASSGKKAYCKQGVLSLSNLRISLLSVLPLL